MSDCLYSMKRIILYSLIILIPVACKKFLHEEEISIGKIENYDQMVYAAGGVYGGLANSLLRSTSNFYAPNMNGDDLNGSSNYDSYYITHFRCYDYWVPTKTYTPNTWSKLYKVIISANNIICQFKNSSIRNNPENNILGEIYLLRAYCYLRLTRTFGQVPLIDNIDINYEVTKPSFAEIYTFIESDLKTAMELLPKNNSSARIPFVTPHHGSAKAMLAEVYLSWAGYPCKDASKYLLAAKEAGETIDSARYFGLGLVNDFSYLWDKAHLYNSESIFSLFCSDSVTLSISYGTYPDSRFYFGSYDKKALEMRKQINIKQYFYPQYINIGFSAVEINFFNNFPSGHRKEITFFKTIYFDFSQYDSLGNIIHTDTGHIHIDTANTCGRLAYRKFYYEPTLNTRYSNQYLGIPRTYLFRYAQTVLTYAEAMARSGQLNEKAFECINQIRRRAHHLNLNTTSVYDLQPGLSPEVFADSVVWERAWELCGEPEGRWFDLVRLEKVEDLPKIRNPKEGGWPVTFDKSSYFFPVDPSDTLLNPNLGRK
jgi:starch-binding outer membrane protein, SusD/RagB family